VKALKSAIIEAACKVTPFINSQAKVLPQNECKDLALPYANFISSEKCSGIFKQ
jgi:hypothetical protein